jgi:acyl carrier protein
MNKEPLLQALAKLLEVKIEQLDDNYLLNSKQMWDSLSVVSTIASIDNCYKVSVSGDQLESCETVGDIFELVNKKLASKDNVIFMKS